MSLGKVVIACQIYIGRNVNHLVFLNTRFEFSRLPGPIHVIGTNVRVCSRDGLPVLNVSLPCLFPFWTIIQKNFVAFANCFGGNKFKGQFGGRARLQGLDGPVKQVRLKGSPFWIGPLNLDVCLRLVVIAMTRIVDESRIVVSLYTFVSQQTKTRATTMHLHVPNHGAIGTQQK